MNASKLSTTIDGIRIRHSLRTSSWNVTRRTHASRGRVTRCVLKHPFRPAHLHVPRNVGLTHLHAVSVCAVVVSNIAVVAWDVRLRARCIVCRP